jgi:nitric oxide reductase subunit B
MATTIGKLDGANLNGGQKLAVKYFIVAMVLFGAQILFGLISGLQYLKPDLFYEVLDFNVNRMVHINAMIVWLLCGFMGSVYWLLEEEAQHEVVGLKLGNLIFWVLTAAVTVVVLVFLFVQVGPGKESSIWRAGRTSASW